MQSPLCNRPASPPLPRSTETVHDITPGIIRSSPSAFTHTRAFTQSLRASGGGSVLSAYPIIFSHPPPSSQPLCTHTSRFLPRHALWHSNSKLNPLHPHHWSLRLGHILQAQTSGASASMCSMLHMIGRCQNVRCVGVCVWGGCFTAALLC